MSRTLTITMTMLLVACSPPDLGDEFTPEVRDEPTPDDDDDADDDDATDTGLNIIEVDDPDAEWVCDALGGPVTCSSDYLDLAAVLAPPELDLDTCVAESAARHQEVIDGFVVIPEDDFRPTAEELSLRVRQELGVVEWVDEIDDRPLTVTRRGGSETEFYSEEVFLLSDPLVGTFELRFLRPFVDGPLPVVIGMPGHPLSDDQTEDFLDEHHGYTYLENGYAVAVLGFRAYDSSWQEHAATASLLCAGSSMVSVKNYEVLLVHKLMRHYELLGRVDGIGLIGHSGGSVAGNALIRYLYDDVDAFVTDLNSSYLNVQPCMENKSPDLCVIDETHLGLLAVHARINDFNFPRLTVPYLEQEYGYPDGPAEVLEFLDSVLRGSEGR